MEQRENDAEQPRKVQDDRGQRQEDGQADNRSGEEGRHRVVRGLHQQRVRRANRGNSRGSCRFVKIFKIK